MNPLIYFSRLGGPFFKGHPVMTKGYVEKKIPITSIYLGLGGFCKVSLAKSTHASYTDGHKFPFRLDFYDLLYSLESRN